MTGREAKNRDRDEAPPQSPHEQLEGDERRRRTDDPEARPENDLRHATPPAGDSNR